jgi:flagellar hook-basal body protein
MGIFDAMQTSVGGLSAQSFALQNISGNIANASTTGYKGINTSFEDLIPDATTPSRQVAGGVTAFAQQTITTQGSVSASTVATNMAITGDGFFSVQRATAVVDNVPVFSGVTNYTRRGDFQVNANGNLVNGAGYYLMGVTVDPRTGNPIGNVPQVLQFQNNFIPAQATTTIRRQPADPAENTGKHDSRSGHHHGARWPQSARFHFEPAAAWNAGRAVRRQHSRGECREQPGRTTSTDYGRHNSVGRAGERLLDDRFHRRSVDNDQRHYL